MSVRGSIGRLAPGAVSLTDQGISSASNMLAVLMVARTVDKTTFGQFSLAYSVLTLVLGLVRAYYGNRISMTASPAQARRETQLMVGGAIAWSGAAAVVVVVASWLLIGRAGTTIPLVVGAATVLICAQDLVRFGAIASDRAWVALVSDSVWLLLVVGAIVGLPDGAGTPLVLLLWLGAIAVALAVALVAFDSPPMLRSGAGEMLVRIPMSLSLAWGSLTATGAMLAVTASASALIEPSAAGALRGAATLLGPLNVLIAYVSVAIVPVVVRRPRRGDLRAGLVVSGVLVAAALASWFVLALLPDNVGVALLGDSWTQTRDIINLVAIQNTLLAAAVGSTLILRVRLRARVLASQKGLVALATVVLGVAGAALGDVRYTAAGLIGAAAFAVLLGWRHAHRALEPIS